MRCRGRLGSFDGIVPSLACILTKQYGVRGGKYSLKTSGNSISETLNFTMSLAALALKNLCLWCEFQSRLLFIIRQLRSVTNKWIMIGFVSLKAVPAVSVKYDCRFCNESSYCSALEMEEKNVIKGFDFRAK